MLTAGFFQQDKETTRLMNRKFKDLGYDLKGKKAILNEVLGYIPKLNDMTISEKEEVLRHLDTLEPLPAKTDSAYGICDACQKKSVALYVIHEEKSSKPRCLTCHEQAKKKLKP